MRKARQFVNVFLIACVGVMVMPCEAGAQTRDSNNLPQTCVKNPGPNDIVVKEVIFKDAGGNIVGSQIFNVTVKAGKKRTFTVKTDGTETRVETVTAVAIRGGETCTIFTTLGVPACDNPTLCFGNLMEVSELDGCAGCVPTVSEWGLLAMLLLVLTVGTVVFNMRRRPAAV